MLTANTKEKNSYWCKKSNYSLSSILATVLLRLLIFVTTFLSATSVALAAQFCQMQNPAGDIAWDIQDNGSATVNFNFTAGDAWSSIGAVNSVSMRGKHQYTGDLAAELNSPSGTNVVLFRLGDGRYGEGASNCNRADFDMSFSDTASGPDLSVASERTWCTGSNNRRFEGNWPQPYLPNFPDVGSSPAITGMIPTYNSQGLTSNRLSNFVGDDPLGGNWGLFVEDAFSRDVGTVEEVCLDLDFASVTYDIWVSDNPTCSDTVDTGSFNFGDTVYVCYVASNEATQDFDFQSETNNHGQTLSGDLGGSYSKKFGGSGTMRTAVRSFVAGSADLPAGTTTTLTGSLAVVGTDVFFNGGDTLTTDEQVSITVAPAPPTVLSLTKSSTLPATLAAGQDISYSFTISNTGATNATDVSPSDSGPTFNGVAGTNSLSAFSPIAVDLNAGASQVFTATYTLSQADIDNMAAAGDPTNAIANTATIVATPPPTSTLVTTPGSETTGFTPTQELVVTKSGTMPVTIVAGQDVSYAVTVENTGNVTLSSVSPSDPGPTFNGVAGTNTLSAFAPASVSLAPGASQVFTATYELSQTDIDNMAAAADPATAVANTATATGTTPGGGTPSVTPGSTTTGAAPDAELTVTKTSTLPASIVAGATISYVVTVENTGPLTVTSASATDPGPSFNGTAGTNSLSSFSPAPVTLAPSASQVFTATYVLSQTDVDNIAASADPANAITNTADATGTPPGASTLNTNPGSETTGATPVSGLGVTKSSTLPATLAAGEDVTYSVTVENTGNVTLTGVAPTDPGPSFNGTAGTNSLSSFSPAPVTLAPGTSQVFTATYVLSQSDIDNIALAGDPTSAITNTASAVGATPSGGTPLVTPGSETTGFTPNPELTTTKSSTMPAVVAAGQTISYTVVLENTGNVTLSSVSPVDPGPSFNGVAGTSSLSSFSPASVTMAPNASQSFTATYVLSQTDVDNMASAANPSTAVTNTAGGTGTTPSGGTPTSIDDTDTTGGAPTAALTTSKSASAPSPFVAGASLNYSITITNSGTTTISAVTPIDPGPTFDGNTAANALSAFSPASATLAPGQNQVFTATYVLAQSDIDNMAAAADPSTAIDNTANANGLPPAGVPLTTTPSSASTGSAPNPSLSIVKTAGPLNPSFQVGATVEYSYLVTNNGNVTFTDDIVIADNRIDAAGGSYNCTPAASTDLAPTDTMTCTATYTVTLNDVQIGSVSNNATASSGSETSPIDSATVPPGATPALTITKTTSPASASFVAAGETLTYSYTVQNTGGVALVEPVTVSDDKINGGTPFTCWAPGQSTNGGSTVQIVADSAFPTTTNGDSVTCTAPYTVTQADVDNGSVTNEATGASSFAGTPVSAPPVTLTVNSSPDARLSVAKSVSPSSLGDASPGDVLTYTFVAANDGAITLDDAVPVDGGPLFGGVAGTGTFNAFSVTVGTDANNDGRADTLASGASATFTATYAVTQADLDAAAAAADPNNVVTNSATATATPATGTLAPVTPSTTTAGFVATAELTVSKFASMPAVVTEGQSISYSVTIENTGNVTVTSVTPVDGGPTFNGAAAANSLSAFTPAAVDLAPGASQTFTASYVLDQADIDNAGAATDTSTAISNTADATGTPPAGTTLETISDTALVGYATDPELTVTKSSTMPATVAAGQSITYSVTLENTGNVTVSNAVPVDGGPTFNGSAATNSLAAFAPASATLEPGESQLFTSTYVLDQADIDAASAAPTPTVAIANTASATGSVPGTNPLNVIDARDTTGFTPAPGLTAAKTAVMPASYAAGQSITYHVDVTNSGNVTMTGVSASDPGPTFGGINGTNTLSAFAPASASLAPGDTQRFTATYVLSQTDVDNTAAAADPATAAENTARASGTSPSGALFTAPDASATGGFAPAPGLSAAKTATMPATFAAGETITYALEVTNTSLVTITDVTPNDPGPTFGGAAATNALSAFSPATADIAPGTSQTFTATYVLAQADVDNTAAAADPATAVNNTATAQGSAPNGNQIATPPASSTEGFTPAPALSAAKSSSLPSNFAAGQSIAYTVEVTNNGNISVTGVKPNDPGPTFNGTAGANSLSAFSPASADLNPGASQTFTATYVLDQADIDALAAATDPTTAIANTANASGSQPNGTTVTSPNASNTTGTSPAPSLIATKIATLPASFVAGQSITYELEITNNGTVTVNGVTPNDPGPTFNGTAAINSLSAFSPASANLAPGASQTFTATYVLDQADIDTLSTATDPSAGAVNTANASGLAPSGATVTSPDATVTGGFTPAPGLTAAKTAVMPASYAAGQSITYHVDVTNSGNVTMTGVSASDPGPTFGGINGTNTLSAFAPASASLAPGDTQRFTATYVLSQTDVDNTAAAADPATAAENTARASGTSPSGALFTAPDASATGGFAPAPGLSAAKTATMPATFAAGETITYALEVTNTSLVTITDVTPNDPGPTFGGAAATNALSAFSPATADIAPGTSQTFTATYVLAQADVDNTAAAADPATAVNNTATAQGSAPNGNPIATPPASSTEGFTPAPGLEVLKSADTSALSTPTTVGDVIDYEITVENTGNVTITGIALTDTLTDNGGNPLTIAAPSWQSSTAGSAVGTLLPGETATYTTSYTLTQSDLDSGGVRNSVLAEGQEPDGTTVSDTSDDPSPASTGGAGGGPDDPTATSFNLQPSIEVTKTALLNDGGDGGPDPGDTIDFTYVIENTGNVTVLDAVPVEDAATFTGNNTLPVPAYSSGGSNQDADGLSDDILPGETITFTATYVLVQADIEQLGASNQVNATGSTNAAGAVTDVSDNGDDADGDTTGDPTRIIFTPPQVQATKTANVQQAEVGQTVTFTIVMEHQAGGAVAGIDIVDQLPTGLKYTAGSATLNGAPSEPTASGNELIWSGLAMSTGDVLRVDFDAVVNQAAPDGGVENIAFFRAPATGEVVSNIARILVEKEPIYIFECSDIIGRVYQDLNLSGYPDQGEPGMPNAHVYTVNGVKIITDEHGRYHVPCAELPKDIGSNYILKVDERSLPNGWHLTSTNPKVLRLTKGKMAQFNFGVMKAALIEIEVDNRAFVQGRAEPETALDASIERMIDAIASKPSIIRLDYKVSGEGQGIAKRRLKELEDQIQDAWRGRGQYTLNIEMNVVR
jgi:uncharacterized repeat protein (TIGR01451 family)